MDRRRHLDTRRHGLPRDYLRDPYLFGQTRRVEIVMPDGGDLVSQRVAQWQHELFVAWRERGRRPSGAHIAALFEFSTQTWSRTSLGERWICATVIVAASWAMRTDTPDPTDPNRRRAR